MLGIQVGYHLGLLTVVNDSALYVVADEVVLGSCEQTIQSCNLSLEELNDVAGFTIAQLLVLTGKDLVQDIERVIGNTGIVGSIANIDNITLVKLHDFEASGDVVNTEVGMIVKETEQVIILSRLLVCFQIGVCRSLAVLVDKRLDVSGDAVVQRTEMFCGDVVVVLVGITVHHAACEQTE